MWQTIWSKQQVTLSLTLSHLLVTFHVSVSMCGDRVETKKPFFTFGKMQNFTKSRKFLRKLFDSRKYENDFRENVKIIFAKFAKITKRTFSVLTLCRAHCECACKKDIT
jgi:hypothetical protein